MTARLTLICHAPTASTRVARFPLDEPPDADGAAALAHAEPRLTAATRLTAPERRARATAAALDPAFAVDAALRDQDFGRWAGRSLADLAAEEPDAVAAWMGDPAAAPHGGESLLGLLARVAARMEAWAATGGRVAAVTHPAWVRAAAVTALGAGAGSFWRVEAPPLARAALSHDGRRWTLTGLVPPPRS